MGWNPANLATPTLSVDSSLFQLQFLKNKIYIHTAWALTKYITQSFFQELNLCILNSLFYKNSICTNIRDKKKFKNKMNIY